MASLGEIAILALEEIVEELVAELVIDEAVQDAILAESETIENAINEVVEAGGEDEEALGNTYSHLSTNYSDVVADSWAESMEEQGYDVRGAPEETEDADFQDTDPESNPDKGEVESEACEEDPESPACLAQKQSRLSRFWEWFKSALGVVGTAGGAVIIGLIVYLIGGMLRLACKAWYTIFGCTPDTPGETPAQCRSDKCDTRTCQAVTKLVQDIRKYFMWIMIVLFTLMISTTIYFRSTKTLWIFGILIIITIAMNTFIGNFFATAICNFDAVGCLATTGTITCRD